VVAWNLYCPGGKGIRHKGVVPSARLPSRITANGQESLVN
jgi:hypothetical protein